MTISSRLTNLEVSPQFNSYSKVRIIVSDDTVYEVGNDDGRTLEIENPFGTQAMAQTILNSLSGFQYQPYQADGALLDPAAEIGDAANMRGNYGGIYTRDRTFGRLMKADISAPCDEEINHEYAYEAPETREFKRSIGEVKASLIIANDRIDAKVSQTGGTNSTFSWSLTSSAHTWYANGSRVMKISKADGLEVSGKVTATSGKIGGFTISASAIYNNISSFDGPQSTGVYIGTNGVQLGQKFKVDTRGNVTATRMVVDTLVIGGTEVSADTLNSRANSAYTSTSIGGFCYTGAQRGNDWNNTKSSTASSRPSIYVGTVMCNGISSSGSITSGSGYVTCQGLVLSSYQASWKSATVKKSDGTNLTIFYIGR